MSSAGLEYLCFKHGFFYKAHRASIDCIALCRLMQLNQPAFAELLDIADKEWTIVLAVGSPFSTKDTLKMNGYRWIGGVWQKFTRRDLVGIERKFLSELYPSGGEMAQTKDVDKTVRFRKFAS